MNVISTIGSKGTPTSIIRSAVETEKNPGKAPQAMPAKRQMPAILAPDTVSSLLLECGT
jgi:hypothetical protein